MDLEGARALKKEVEDKISRILNEFVEETGLHVEDVQIMTASHVDMGKGSRTVVLDTEVSVEL